MRYKPRKNRYAIRYRISEPVHGFFSGQVVSYHIARYKRTVRAETWEKAVEQLAASIHRTKPEAIVEPLLIRMYDPFWDDFNRPPWVIVYQRKEESPDE